MKSRRDLKSRRDFLRPSPGEGPRQGLQLLRLGRPAMGTRFEAALRSNDRSFVREVHSALGEIRRLESILTVFSEESDLCRLNSSASREWYRPDPDLWDLLSSSLEYCRKTGGALDISCGPLWKLWGFYSRNPGKPGEADIEKVLQKTGYNHILLNQEARKVKFLQAGMEINLGSTGKGYALDRAAAMLQNRGLDNFLLNAGNSSFYAAGSLTEEGEGWRIGIREPGNDAGGDIALAILKDAALATSGSGVKFFEFAGRRFGHIIDARTGWPVRKYLSATAIADDVLEADALSTAFFAMELSEIRDFCGSNPGTGALVIPADTAGNPGEPCLVGRADEVVELI